MTLKMGIEPAGIVKLEPSFRSMMFAWLMKKVESWAKEMESAIVDAHTGRILAKDLNSSTCVTVQSLQRFLVSASGSVTTAALSKKLCQHIRVTRILYLYSTMNEYRDQAKGS